MFLTSEFLYYETSFFAAQTMSAVGKAKKKIKPENAN